MFPVSGCSAFDWMESCSNKCYRLTIDQPSATWLYNTLSVMLSVNSTTVLLYRSAPVVVLIFYRVAMLSPCVGEYGVWTRLFTRKVEWQRNYMHWGKKNEPLYFCSKFVKPYCTEIIIGTHILQWTGNKTTSNSPLLMGKTEGHQQLT